MSQIRGNSVLTPLRLFRYELPALTICVASLVAVGAHAQKVPNTPNSATNGEICEGTLPPQASSQASSSESQSAGASDRFKLSTQSTHEDSVPEGQYCKRDRSDQKPARTSQATEPSETTSPPPQPVAAPPVARVTDGNLTINASGQDLASILASVRSATGLTVEMPSETVNSGPVFLNAGPAPVADVLVALLQGSSYNYIIVGSERDPRLVKRLILTQRTTGGSDTLLASSQAPPVAQQPALYGGVQPDDEAEASEPPPPPQQFPVPAAGVPSSVPKGINVQKLAAESGKSPGQILGELQKQQQQVLDEQATQSQSAPQQ